MRFNEFDTVRRKYINSAVSIGRTTLCDDGFHVYPMFDRSFGDREVIFHRSIGVRISMVCPSIGISASRTTHDSALTSTIPFVSLWAYGLQSGELRRCKYMCDREC